MNHIIKKQVIELRLGKKMDAFRIQHAVSEHYRTAIVPILERLFDSISTEDEVLTLDKLEIDLGRFSRDSIERNKWSGEIESRLKEQLQTLVAASRMKKDGTQTPKPISVCRQWLFYMRHGYLPWNTVKADDQWYNDVLEALAVDFASVQGLRDLISGEGEPLKRLVSQHPDHFLQRIAGILTAQDQQALASIIHELHVLQTFLNQRGDQQAFSQTTPGFRKSCWTKLLAIAAKEKVQSSGEQLPALLIDFILKEYPAIDTLPAKIRTDLPYSWPLIQRHIGVQELEHKGRSKNSDDLAAAELEAGQANLPSKNAEATDPNNPGVAKQPTAGSRIQNTQSADEEHTDAVSNKKDKSSTGQEANVGLPAEHAANLKSGAGADEHVADQPASAQPTDKQHTPVQTSIPGRSQKQSPDTSRPNTPGGFESITEEGIFVSYAGMVLLHPFLNSLFKRVQLVQDGQFIDRAAHQTALHLLHYLACGDVESPEHTLVIAKLLCAYPLEDTVDLEIELAAEILAEADDMMLAAIGQWTILKNTSPAGLREGFLQRNGKLFSKNDSLYLQVEQSSIDMLLDSLPWNLSMIRLPWMKEILRVEWR